MKSQKDANLFLTPRRAQCIAPTAAVAGATAAAGADLAALARADPALAPRLYDFKGFPTNTDADFPKP